MRKEHQGTIIILSVPYIGYMSHRNGEKKKNLLPAAFCPSIMSEPLMTGFSTLAQGHSSDLNSCHSHPSSKLNIPEAAPKVLLPPTPTLALFYLLYSLFPPFSSILSCSQFLGDFVPLLGSCSRLTDLTLLPLGSQPHFGYRPPGLLPFSHSWPPSCPSLPSLWLDLRDSTQWLP